MSMSDYFAGFALVVIAVMVISVGFVSIGSGTDGTATDSITRISYGGWIWKTWRVELTNDHPISGDYSDAEVVYKVEAMG